MATYRDEAIAIRSLRLGEADRIVTFITPEHGKVRAVAKGVRKTKSRLGARVEPPCHMDLLCWHGRELDIINQAETVDGFRALREDLGLLGAALAMLEATEQVAPEHSPARELFALVLGALRSLEQSRSPLVLGAFFLKLLSLEGVGPVTDACATCGAPGPLVAFDLGEGGFLCASCRRGQSTTPEVASLAHAVLSGGLARALVTTPVELVAAFERLTTSAVEYHLDRRLRATHQLLEPGSETEEHRYPRPMTNAPEPNAPRANDASLFEAIVNLSKRRGFVFPSAEIYGGIRSTYDYGPLGSLMLRNVREAWWRAMVQKSALIVPIDAAILTNPKVWEASGHLATFTDPLVDCRKCQERWRADQIDGVCPNCGSTDLTEARPFNLMFKTFVGPVEDDASVAYLRPETAEGMFVNFLNVMTSMRLRPPFGIAQIGRSFRNEITPGNFVFRTREFEQMELEFFVPPSESARWFEFWCGERMAWYQRYGIPSDKLRLRQHDPGELSHYSTGTADIEFLFPWGWGELEGIVNRTDFDLKAHSDHSGVRLEYFDQQNNERYTPHVIEPAAGVTRTMMAFMLAAYDEDEVSGERRTVLRLHPRLAPYQVAVLPLSRNERLTPLAQEVAAALRARFVCEYDDTQSIGRRYRRQDEIGTPLCVTVDFDSLEDHAVTIRERDTTEQARVPIAQLVTRLVDRLGS